MIGVGLQLSVAVAVPVPFAPPGAVLAVQARVKFGGQVIAGGVLSSMTIICVQVAVLPQSSLAVQVRLIVYSCGQVGLGVIISLDVIFKTGSQLSVAVAVPAGPPGAVLAEHCNVKLAGQVITGGVLSSTDID